MKIRAHLGKWKQRVGGWSEKWGGERGKALFKAFSPVDRIFSQSYPESLPPAPPVVVVGEVESATGLGEVARGSLRALRTRGHSATYVALPPLRKISEHEIPTQMPLPPGRRINLVHNMLATRMAYRKLGSRFFRRHFNIGYWFWEQTVFPRDCYANFAPFNEIWVASRFCQSLMANVSPIPVVWVPPLLEPAPLPPRARAEMGLPEDRFIFYFAFDAMSILARKNPLALIEAYRRAFGTNAGKTCLVLKISGAQQAVSRRHATGASLRDFGELSKRLHEVGGVLINRQLSRDDTNALMSMCDCYVSLHRTEGFGMTIAEAMYYGKPTIATAYSGNLDFMTPLNSLGVGYRIVELEQDYGPYKAGTQWADPDIDHAAECMLRVYTERERAQAMGEQAAQDIRRNYSAERVGEIMLDRMRLVAFSNR